MAAGVNVKRAAAPGGWTTTDQVLVRRNNVWVAVQAAWVKRAAAPGGWALVFQLTQDAPMNLRPISATNSSGTIAWDAAPRATEYQLVVRTGTAAPVYKPWTANLSDTATGLLLDTSYTFTVQARRAGVAGTFVVSPESTSKLTLFTGHPVAPPIQNPEYPASKTDVLVTAVASNTWDNDTKWRAWTQGQADIVQGYLSSAVKNGYGCVRYGKGSGYTASGVWNQLRDRFGATVADNIEVRDAKIDHIYRKTGGGGTPTINVYPCDINFSSNARPDNVFSGTTFRAPAEADSKDNVDFADTDRLLNWAQAWADKSNTHNGLLIFNTGGAGNPTNGYNGYAILRGANVNPADWRLVLSVRWNIPGAPAVPPIWATA